MIDIDTTLEAMAAIITAIGGIYTAIRKWVKHAETKRQQYKDDILNQARSEAEKIRQELEDKIQKLEVEVETQKQNIYKDLGYLKESHNTEIRNLSEKIENLREDLKVQHTSILSLLTKLIDTK